MNPQNQGSGSSTPLDPPQRRKRGRPRKDENLLQGENILSAPGSDNMPRNTQNFGSVVAGSSEVAGSDMIGQAVSGVVDGKFDAGYLLKVKVGDSDNYLRGVVFLPNRVVPVSASNDLAPQVKMYTRADVPIPALKQPQLQGSVPSFEQNEKQSAELRGFKSTGPEQGMSFSDHQRKENQFASVTLPLTDNFRASSMGIAPAGNIISQQILVSGSESRSPANLAQTGSGTASKENELLLEFDASMKKVELASKSSRSDAVFDGLPASGTVNLELQMQHQADDFSDRSSTPTNIGLIRAPASSEAGCGIVSSESVHGMSISLADPTCPGKASRNAGTITEAPSHLNGGHAAEISQADAKCTSPSCVPVVASKKEGIFYVPKLDAEGSSLEKILDSQFGCSAGTADSMKVDSAMTTSRAPQMDLFEKEADPGEPKLGNEGALAVSMGAECTSAHIKDAEP